MTQKTGTDQEANEHLARTNAEVQSELAQLDQGHFVNEGQRDAFLALAHTALFAATVAFVGDIPSGTQPTMIWALIMAWAASVVGLLALCISFEASRRHIDKRRQQVHGVVVDSAWLPKFLNAVALWSFPLALISTFGFTTANMLHMSSDPNRPPSGPTHYPPDYPKHGVIIPDRPPPPPPPPPSRKSD